MNIKLIIHIIVFIFICSTVFFPMSLLKKGCFIIPFLVSTSWVVFDGCILNSTKGNERKNDLYIICQTLNIQISHSRCKYIICSGIVLLPTIMFARLMVECGKE